MTLSVEKVNSPQEAPKAGRRLCRYTSLSDAQRQEVIADYLAGISLREITARYGIHRDTVLQICKKAGHSARRRGLTPEQAQEAAALYANGRQSLAAIGKHFGVSPTTIHRYLVMTGVEIRPRRGRAS